MIRAAGNGVINDVPMPLWSNSMRLLDADLNIPVSRFTEMLEAVDPQGAEEFVDRIGDWFAERGLVVKRGEEGISGFDAAASDFSGEQSFFEALAPFVSGSATVELGGDELYLVGTIEDGEWAWEKHSPGSAKGWYELGEREYSQRGRTFVCLFHYEQACRYPDASVAAWNNRMWMLMRLGRNDDARAVSDKVIEMAEAEQIYWLKTPYRSKGLIELRARDFETAHEYFDRVLTLDPSDLSSWYNKACAYALDGKTDEALAALERAAWDDTKQRKLAAEDEDLKSLRGNDEFESILRHGIRDYRRGQKGEIKEKIKSIRELLLSGDAAKRQEAIDRAIEYDDRFVFYQMLDGSSTSPTGWMSWGDIFSGPEIGEVYRLEYLQFLARLPADVLGAVTRQGVGRLRVIDESHLQDLSFFSAFEGLQMLEFSYCEKISDLTALAGADSIEELRLNNLCGLTSLDGLQHLPNLRSLTLEKCENLDGIELVGELEQLRELTILNCSQIADVDVLADLTALEAVDLRGFRHDVDAGIFAEMSGLKRLSLWPRVAPDVEFTNFETLADKKELRELKLADMRRMERLQKVLSGLTKLEWLHLENAAYLKDPSVFEEMSELRKLVLWGGCGALESMSVFSSLEKLEKIELRGCGRLRDLEGLQGLERLEELEIRQAPLLKSVAVLEGHRSLKEVLIYKSGLKMAAGLSKMPRLERLNIGQCNALIDVRDLRDLPSLKSLSLTACASLTDVDGLRGLPALSRIDLGYCKALENIDGLAEIESLEVLNLRTCPSLLRIEGIANLPRLEKLHITARSQLNVAPDARSLQDEEVAKYQKKIRKKLGI